MQRLIRLQTYVRLPGKVIYQHEHGDGTVEYKTLDGAPFDMSAVSESVSLGVEKSAPVWFKALTAPTPQS